MKVIEKTIMPDGTKIQLEDWSDHNTEKFPNLHGLQIGAYPVASHTGKYRWIKDREIFRLTIAMNEYHGYSNTDVKIDFEALKSGEKRLEDLESHFWNGKKDMWYLGTLI